MDQVRRELQENAELQKSMREFQESSIAERGGKAAEQLSRGLSSAGEKIKSLKSQAERSARETKVLLDQLSGKIVFGRQISTVISYLLKKASEGSRIAVAALQGAINLFSDDRAERAKARASAWEASQSSTEEKNDDNEIDFSSDSNTWDDSNSLNDSSDTSDSSISSDLNNSSDSSVLKNSSNNALVLSSESVWEQFGTKLRDMPFLQSFFENPLLGKLFGETAEAAAIRQVKEIMPGFRLSHLIEMAQYVIAPQILDWFLNGNEAMLKLHCGEAAYAAAAKSLIERTAVNVVIDPTVLWLRNVELRGAMTPPGSELPWFIFTFNAQQINCVRDKHGKVLLGAPDDIREVMYSMALTPQTNSSKKTKFPWKVAELAIIGNVPSW